MQQAILVNTHLLTSAYGNGIAGNAVLVTRHACTQAVASRHACKSSLTGTTVVCLLHVQVAATRRNVYKKNFQQVQPTGQTH